MGYDVSDYQRIYAPYGKVGDVDKLLEACHVRGMKLILDLVINHTSSQHEWFKASRSSKDNAKRDWYIWRPARYDQEGRRQPPTNWRGYFAGPTWTWDEATEEYYLHLYASDQPDLNWESKSCREAIYDNAIRFWLERGVDGFRVDTVNKYSKRQDFIDAPVVDPKNDSQPAPDMWCNGPRIHEFLKEMTAETFGPYSAVTVGELSNTPCEQQVLDYVSAAEKELSMVFQFDMIRLGTGGGFGGKYCFQPWKLRTLKYFVSKWQKFIEGTDGWTTVFCENHDNGRAVSRFGSDHPDYWARSAKMIALWQATLTGTLFLYQGQEIGMTNAPRDWSIDEYKDVESNSFYQEALASGDKGRVRQVMDGLRILARDHSRLPFHWDDSAYAGFTSKASANPWMRINENYQTINVAKQEEDPDSILSFYKDILKMRKERCEVFIHGTFELLDEEDENVFAYRKSTSTSGGETAIVVLSFSQFPRQMPPAVQKLIHGYECKWKLLKTNILGTSCSDTLLPFEGRVYVH